MNKSIYDENERMIYDEDDKYRIGFEEERSSNLLGMSTGIIIATIIGLSALVILIPKTLLTNYFMSYFASFNNNFTLINNSIRIINTGLLVSLIPAFTNLSNRRLRLTRNNFKVYLLILFVMIIFGIVNLSAVIKQINQALSSKPDFKTLLLFYSMPMFSGVINMAELMVIETAFLKMMEIYNKFSGKTGILSTIYFIIIMVCVNTFNRIVFYLFNIIRNMEISKGYIYNWSQKMELFKTYIKNKSVYEKLFQDTPFILSTLIIIAVGILVFIGLYIKDRKNW